MHTIAHACRRMLPKLRAQEDTESAQVVQRAERALDDLDMTLTQFTIVTRTQRRTHTQKRLGNERNRRQTGRQTEGGKA